MVLVKKKKKKTNRSIEQNRQHKNRPTQVELTTFSQRQNNGTKTALLSNGPGIAGHPYAKKNLDTDIITSTKIISKWMINLKCKTIRLLEDNIGKNLGGI